ncbi:MAG: DUF922 domain-containing protein [Ahrensia sp.]|nr:DUF922 domain-containing protein [Ahrensia sp.]
MRGVIRVFAVAALCTLMTAGLGATAALADLKIREVTKHYRITGSTVGQLAASMSKRGPYSRQHRRRAWATASRDMTYLLSSTRGSSGCKVRGVKVRMTITYQMPRPSSLNRLSKRHRTKWRQLYRLLDGHEKVHGRFYREFAKKVERQLRRMRPARSCRELDRRAAAIVKKLGDADSARNDRFDARDSRTYRRVERIYTSS